MIQRLLLALLLASVAYFVIQSFKQEEFTNWDSVVETPAYAPPQREPMPRGPMNVSPGGPNSPNVEAPRMMPGTMSPPAEASDPYAVTQEDAYAPEHLRHPERSFSPGIVPETGAIAVAGGLASQDPASSSQAFQQFSPEFVQNGGSFFGTVSALEDENPNYSAF